MAEQNLNWYVRLSERFDCEIIAEVSDAYRITYFRQKVPARILVVTFATLYSDLDTPPFGLSFLIGEGCDQIHVAQGGKGQYQGLSREEFRLLVGPHCTDRRVFTYGSSLGGYAAIYYGSTVNAVAIASSPVLPAHPSVKRFGREKIPIRHEPMEHLVVGQRTYVFHDPHDEDDTGFISRHVAPACSDLVITPLPYSGHQSLRALAGAGLLKDVIRSIIHETPAVLQIDVERMLETSVCLEEMAVHSERNKRFAEAMEIAQRCLAKERRLRAYNLLIRCALKLDDLETARRVRDEARTYFPDHRLQTIPEAG